MSVEAGGHSGVLVLNRRGGVRLLRCATCHELGAFERGRPPVARPRRPGCCLRRRRRAPEVLCALRWLAAGGAARRGATPGCGSSAHACRAPRWRWWTRRADRCPMRRWSSAPKRCCTATRCAAAARRRCIRRLRRRAQVPAYRAAEQAVWLVVRAAHGSRPTTAPAGCSSRPTILTTS